MDTSITYAAMDTHKKAHTVTWLDPKTGETEAFDIHVAELEHCEQRLVTLTHEVEALAERPEYKELVGLLCCFHGIQTLTAFDRRGARRRTR